MRLYIGTYTIPGSVGIYRGVFDQTTGGVKVAGQVETPDPSFLALGPDGRVLYAANEGKTGTVSAFAVDPGTGDLSPLGDSQPTDGSAPCHLALDGTGRWIVAANYSSGNGAVFPIRAGGSIGPATDRFQHRGSGPSAGRQEGPHAHSATFDGTGGRCYVADLGIDRVMIYDLDRQAGRLTAADPPSVSLPPGSGPRHMAFHRELPFAFVISELGSTMTSFRHNPETGALTEIQTVTTLPEGFSGESSCADVHIHPNGRFVYGSNRGHDSIVVFRLDQKTGQLATQGHAGQGVAWPRNFALDPTGRFLLVANKKGNDIVTFSVDRETGLLQPTGQRCEVTSPVCLVFAPA